MSFLWALNHLKCLYFGKCGSTRLPHFRNFSGWYFYIYCHLILLWPRLYKRVGKLIESCFHVQAFSVYRAMRPKCVQHRQPTAPYICVATPRRDIQTWSGAPPLQLLVSFHHRTPLFPIAGIFAHRPIAIIGRVILHAWMEGRCGLKHEQRCFCHHDFYQLLLREVRKIFGQLISTDLKKSSPPRSNTLLGRGIILVRLPSWVWAWSWS